MALKDLTAQKSALAEEAIEEIVADFIRYDVDDKEIVLTAEGAKLPNKSKILVFIVALQGWPFVSDQAVPTDVKPSDLEEKLGIPGGTLRPTLKDLKDRHILVARSGRYSARTASLQAIKEELKDADRGSGRSRSTRQSRKKSATKTKSAEPDQSATSLKSPGGGSVRIPDWIAKWIKDGFFEGLRTLGDVQNHFHELGMIVPQHRLSTPMKKAVTPSLDEPAPLKRSKREVNGKKVWVYTINK